jgi:hypothetical protein
MILGRVIEHVKQQHWTAIIIELVIVVLGVFIGIQVSNWNAARADQERAQGYLERVRDDLDADIAGYGDRLALWGNVYAFGSKGLAYADTGDAAGATQWDLLLAYFQASQVGAFNLTEATYDELRSAGELRLLGDPHLRDQLASYYTNSNYPALSESPDYRKHVRGIIPLEIQAYVWKNCWEADATGKQRLLACSSPVDEARAAAVVDEIRANATLMHELRYWMSTMLIADATGRRLLDSATELRSAVDAKIGDRESASVSRSSSP